MRVARPEDEPVTTRDAASVCCLDADRQGRSASEFQRYVNGSDQGEIVSIHPDSRCLADEIQAQEHRRHAVALLHKAL